MDISIIILNYKSKGFALNCIKSIRESDFGNLQHEIIVVDNNSRDGIKEILAWQYPEVVFIQNENNLGMGGGNNVGIRRARGKYVAIMNPDTLVFNDTFNKLFNLMEADRSIGVAGPLQYNPDRTVQDTCYRWHSFLTPVFRRLPIDKITFVKKDLDRFLMKDYNKSMEKEVDWLMGSFLFCRAEALKQTGLFDEKFFMYFEDTDLCRRFWKKKWKVIFYPEAKIIHNHIRLSAKDPWYIFFTNRATRNHIYSWIKYLWKWRFSN